MAYSPLHDDTESAEKSPCLLQFLTGAPGQLSPSVNKEALQTQQQSEDKEGKNTD